VFKAWFLCQNCFCFTTNGCYEP